jgi:hypothetical protein
MDQKALGCSILWMANDGGDTLQLVGRCGSCSTEFGAGGAAGRARNSKQEAPAFYDSARAATIAG